MSCTDIEPSRNSSYLQHGQLFFKFGHMHIMPLPAISHFGLHPFVMYSHSARTKRGRKAGEKRRYMAEVRKESSVCIPARKGVTYAAAAVHECTCHLPLEHLEDDLFFVKLARCSHHALTECIPNQSVQVNQGKKWWWEN